MITDDALVVLEYCMNVLAVYGDTKVLSDIQRELSFTDQQCRDAFGNLHELALVNFLPVPGEDGGWVLVPLVNNIAHFVAQRAAESN